VIPLVCAIPKSSRHDTHHRIAHFAAAISSHPKRSANRAAPSLIETRNQLFIAGASILEEDGESTSLGILGQFASKDSAFEFALRSATAFVEGRPMPRAPFEIPEAKDVCSKNRLGNHEKVAAAPENQVKGSRR